MTDADGHSAAGSSPIDNVSGRLALRAPLEHTDDSERQSVASADRQGNSGNSTICSGVSASGDLQGSQADAAATATMPNVSRQQHQNPGRSG